MCPGDGQTLSLARRDDRADGTTVEPHLFLVIQAARPRSPAARFRLGELDEVLLTRGPQRRVELEAEAGRRRLRLVIDDGWMSTDHARLTREGERWRLVDQRSKNGTLINGARQREAMLLDQDLIELGQTFFVFRAALATPVGATPRLDAADLDAPPGLATLLPALAARFDELRRLAGSRTSIVIRGPSGTGKELLARAIHELSGRRGPFVAVNCAALPEALVESELFGHVRGAFSGADRDREGLIAAASGGTLFLDEIGDLAAPAQAKLLRALQEQEVRPVGATRTTAVDLRVVAATHRDLGRMVEAEQFREDLLARLGGTFELPPLRDRREDLGLVIGALLGRHEDPRARAIGFSGDAARALLGHAWPRNVRELEKVLERAIALGGGGDVDVAHLPEEVLAPPERAPAPAAALPAHERERRHQIVELLRAHDGNITAAAKVMGKARSQVQRWIKRYGIDVDAIDEA